MTLGRPLAQLAIVTGLSGAALIMCDWLAFRSGWNSLWMVGIPLAVAWAFDYTDGGVRGAWPLAGLALLIWNGLSLAVIASLVGIGP